MDKKNEQAQKANVRSAAAKNAAALPKEHGTAAWKVRIAVTSVYFGPVTSDYLYFTLESMKWNRANVDFYCYNVLADVNQAKSLTGLAKKLGVTNLIVKAMTFAQWGSLIKKKINIDLNDDTR